MNLGELFIKLGVKGDTKKLDKAITQLEETEKRTKRIKKYKDDLTKAETKQEKATVKRNFADKVRLDNLKKEKTVLQQQNAQWMGLVKGAAAFIGSVTLAYKVVDRMATSLFRANQEYTTFNRLSGISTGTVNKLSGVSQLASMNMNPSQVMGDLESLQQRIFRIGLEGGDTKIFQMLGFNPIGMQADQVIEKLREIIKLRKMSAQAVTYTLDELGISREWVNVLMLGDKEYADLQEKSKNLYLNEKQRKELAKLQAEQQLNSLRWQKAMNELLIEILPYVIKIMDKVTNFVQKIAESKDALRGIFNVIRDIAVMFGVLNILSGNFVKSLLKLSGLSALGSLFGSGAGKAAGGLAAKTAVKGVGAKLGARVLGNFVPGLNVAMWGWLIWDIFNAGKNIADTLNNTADDLGEASDKINEDFVTPFTNSSYYTNVKTTMTNNFYNNPQPAGQVSAEMNTLIGQYLASRTI